MVSDAINLGLGFITTRVSNLSDFHCSLYVPLIHPYIYSHICMPILLNAHDLDMCHVVIAST